MVRVWNTRTQRTELQRIAMLLPHEIVHAVAAVSERGALTQTDGLGRAAADNFNKASAACGVANAVALGLWVDGVPFNNDRSQSLEVVALSFPGLTGEFSKMRVPITAINKRFVVKQETMDDILQVVKWSMNSLALGKFPTVNHAGQPFNAKDKKRRGLAGKDLQAQGLLAEIRGDWACYKELFRFPSWSSKGSLCFLCKATRASLSDVFERRELKSHWELMQDLIAKGPVNPIFGCPGVNQSTFAVDWLHCADLGVGADFLGNLFELALSVPMLPGNNKAERCSALFLEMRRYYRANGVDSQLPTLTTTMIRKKAGTPPKLRGKAAEIRHLIPFSVELASKLDRSSLSYFIHLRSPPVRPQPFPPAPSPTPA